MHRAAPERVLHVHFVVTLPHKQSRIPKVDSAV